MTPRCAPAPSPIRDFPRRLAERGNLFRTAVSLGCPATPRWPSTSTLSQEVAGPGSISIRAKVGRCGWSVQEVQACHSAAPKLATHTGVAGSLATR